MRRASFGVGLASLLALVSCISLDGYTGGGGADAGAPPSAPRSDANDTTSRQEPAHQPPSPADAGADALPNNPPAAQTSAYATRILADSPLGYWRFEETSGTVVHDSSGHGHDGTYGADVVLGSGGLVGDGFAAKLDGSQEPGARHFIRIPESRGLEPSSWVTMECWVHAAAIASNVSLVSYGSDGPDPFEPYVLWLSNGTPSTYVVANGSGAGTTVPDALTLTEAHHLVSVYDGATVRLYVDGVSVTNSGATGPLGNYDTVNGLGIGSGFSATRATFAGLIDEVAVYDSPLTPKQIAEHHAAARPP